MLLRNLIAFALTTGLARKAWTHYRKDTPRMPVDITEVIARPVATADPAAHRGRASRMGARRRGEGPSS